jgi:ubiquinone/menaquinone biosynthesis C-methylase UbiE
MAESSSGKLRIWEGWAPALAREAPGRPADSTLTPAPLDNALRLAAGEMLRLSARVPEGVEPFTLQWFLDIESARHGRQGKWIPPLLEFTKHSGESLLGLGQGLGTDWVQYARHGAEVLACCPSSEQLALIQKNFELRGLRGTFLHAEPTALPLEPASIDVACITGLLHEVPTPRAVVDEVYRVLKPGGKVLALAPARYDVDFWCRRCFPWHDRGRTRRSGLHLGRTGEDPAGQPAAFSARALRQLFARFAEPRVYKRHLRRSEVPHLWRWVPLSLLERLLGRLLVFKAFKPVSSAVADPLAA